MVWIEWISAARTAWRRVGGGRDRVVDGAVLPWTTHPGRELSSGGPRVVHGSAHVHPPPWKKLSTELSPDVGEVWSRVNAARPDFLVDARRGRGGELTEVPHGT